MAKPRRRSRTRSIALLNQKGGVGKSTTTINIACALAELGARVCVRDMDPQANTTIVLQPPKVTYTINDVLRPDETTGEVVEGCLASALCEVGEQWPRGIYLVPATLTQAERETDQAIGREMRLRVASKGALDAFDVVLDDCPPSVGQLTVNALTADNDALIVSQPEYWSVLGAHQARRTIERVRKFYNPDLEFAGVLVNGFKTGRVESTSRLDELHTVYPGKVWAQVLPDMEVIRKAVGAISPLTSFGRDADVARTMYREVAERFLNE